MAIAATGTETPTGTLKRSMPEAIPANSESVTAKLETMAAAMATAEMRMPNCSRMSAAKPLPVAQAMRAAVSCTTISRMQVMGMDQSIPKP